MKRKTKVVKEQNLFGQRPADHIQRTRTSPKCEVHFHFPEKWLRKGSLPSRLLAEGKLQSSRSLSGCRVVVESLAYSDSLIRRRGCAELPEASSCLVFCLSQHLTSKLPFLESQQRQQRAQRKGGPHLKGEALSLPGSQVPLSCSRGSVNWG